MQLISCKISGLSAAAGCAVCVHVYIAWLKAGKQGPYFHFAISAISCNHARAQIKTERLRCEHWVALQVQA